MFKRQVILVHKLRYAIVCCVMLMSLVGVQAQEDELLGGVQYDSRSSAEGYILFSTRGLTGTYLIDKQGQVVHSWDSDYAPASAMYLLDNGHLLRAGVIGQGREAVRVIEEFDWDGNRIWEYIFDAPQFTQHHDIQPLPNGNVLILARERIPIDEALELGFSLEVAESIPDFDSDSPIEELELDSIFEIDRQTDAIVWEWHVHDHLVQDISPDYPNYGEIADFPRKIDINYHDIVDASDLIHWNSIAYNVDSDLIILSARSFSEVWVIDHNLSSEDAQGDAGDLLYRWGNPASYQHGTLDDRVLYYQHDARWVDDTSADSPLTVFNNGSRKHDILQSTVIEFNFPADWMTDNAFNPPEILWESTADLFAINMSGAQMLPNGNVLMTLAPDGRFVELTPDSDIVWDYINPLYRAMDDNFSNRVFRASFYPPDFVGFDGKDLDPQGELRISIRE